MCRVVDLPVEQSNNNGSQSNEEDEEEGDEEGEEGIDSGEEALMQAFGETAVQGVSWLVHAMGLNNLNQPNGTAATSNGGVDQQQPPTQPASTNV